MKTTAEKIAVMQAFEDGAEIESSFPAGLPPWVPRENPVWNWESVGYRVKPTAAAEALEAFRKLSECPNSKALETVSKYLREQAKRESGE